MPRLAPQTKHGSVRIQAKYFGLRTERGIRDWLTFPEPHHPIPVRSAASSCSFFVSR